MKRNENFHYRWVRSDYVKGQPIPDLNSKMVGGPKVDPPYHLGQSNETAKSKGGIGICVFIAKDGVLLPEEIADEGNELIWVVNPLSSMENYSRKKVRESSLYKVSLPNRPTTLVSKNFEYDVVKKIASHLAEVTQKIYASLDKAKKNQVWKELKAQVNFDDFVASILPEQKDVKIQAGILTAGSGN